MLFFLEAAVKKCWKTHTDTTVIFGRFPSGPRTEDPPRTFYLGNFGNDINECADACAKRPHCSQWTLHLSS